MEWTHAIRPFAAIIDKIYYFEKKTVEFNSWEIDLNVLVVSLD
jgi:hypothetical protein